MVAASDLLAANVMHISGWATGARSAAVEQSAGCAGWASLSTALKIFRLQACVLRDTGKHLRADLFGVVECEDIIGPTLSGECLVGTRLTFDMPADSDQSGKNLPGLRRRPLAHAGMEMLIG